MDAYRNLCSICIQHVLLAIFHEQTRWKLRNRTSGTFLATSCGWALHYGWVLSSLDCSGCGILGFYWLGEWTMTCKRLGRCQMDDCHRSRELFKGRPMLVSFISFHFRHIRLYLLLLGVFAFFLPYFDSINL